MEPELGAMSLPKAPELGRPSSPKRTCVPAKVAESMLVTTSPAQAMTRWPKSKRSTRKAKMNCRPRPQATVRQRMCRRSVEPSQAASEHGENSQNSGKSTQGDLLKSSDQFSLQLT